MQNAFQLWWNENQRLGDNKKKKTTRQVTTSMQLQNSSFQVVYWKRTAAKCAKLKNARATCAKLLVFIAKYANL